LRSRSVDNVSDKGLNDGQSLTKTGADLGGHYVALLQEFVPVRDMSCPVPLVLLHG
jgi:hypothetical protein